MDHFGSIARAGASVLDVGCGQGCDAVFLAELGYHVTGLDLSPHAVDQLNDLATSTGLNIVAHVADVARYRPEHMYDVVLCDRTLHMLDTDVRKRFSSTFLNL